MFFAAVQNSRVHQSAGGEDVSGSRTNCGANHDTCSGVHLSADQRANLSGGLLPEEVVCGQALRQNEGVWGMKVNVEKGLHETAQELEKLAWLCSNSGTCPSLIVLNDALRHAAWLMRLARLGLADQAEKIRKLEEEPVLNVKAAAQEPELLSREEMRLWR